MEAIGVVLVLLVGAALTLVVWLGAALLFGLVRAIARGELGTPPWRPQNGSSC